MFLPSREAHEIALICYDEALGVSVVLLLRGRRDGVAAEAVGAHKPSTLIDLERGRPMEIDALLGAVVEMGRLIGVSMPTCQAVYALVRQRAQMAGCYPTAAAPA